jgi:hypothetical protein
MTVKKLNPDSLKRANEFLKNYGIGVRATGIGLHFDWDATRPDSCAHDRRRMASLGIRNDGFGLATGGTTWNWQEAQQMAKEVAEVMAILVGLEAIDPELLSRG